MWGQNLLAQLKRAGELLDSADDKATTSDLQTLTRDVATGAIGAAKDASKAAKEGAVDAADKVKRLDLGLVEGWNELTNQIGTDLKDVGTKLPGHAGSTSAETLASADIVSAAVTIDSALPRTNKPGSKTAQKLADLRERLQELETRDAERSQVRDRLQLRFDDVDSELGKVNKVSSQGDVAFEEANRASTDSGTAEQPLNDEHEARMEAMRREFLDHLSAADSRIAALEADLKKASALREPLTVELEFWREKTQHMLAAQGFSEIPEEIELTARNGGNTDRALEHPDRDGALRDAQAKEETARAELERMTEEHGTQQRHQAALESRLEELMRSSDGAMGRVDEQRRRERELQAALVAAEVLSTTEAAAAEAAVRQTEAAREALVDAERRYVEEMQVAREAPVQESQGDICLPPSLRTETEALRRRGEDLKRENATLEGRLRKYRAVASADLERAVPLNTPSCWHSIDAPAMKVANFLVRSLCLRRTFAVHLLLTYAWLFFLIFWLEKH